jgi:hypothetical protein
MRGHFIGPLTLASLLAGCLQNTAPTPVAYQKLDAKVTPQQEARDRADCRREGEQAGAASSSIYGGGLVGNIAASWREDATIKAEQSCLAQLGYAPGPTAAQ